MKKSTEKGTWIRKIGVWCFWLFLWQLVSWGIGNAIVLVGPAETLEALVTECVRADFWAAVAGSLSRIFLGFFCAFLLGILLGALACGLSFVRELLEPVVLLLKTVPVASFVILALIWMGSENLAVLITFLIVFPVVYVNTLEGLLQTDPKLLEMARVFRVSFWKRVWHIYRPALWPFLLGGCKVALGLAWKSGIAAEVIGVPANSIGERLYMAKIYLSTAELFAWTLVIIGLSAGFERLFLWALSRIGQAGTAREV